MRLFFCLTALLVSSAIAGDLPRTESSEGAEAYIISPLNGATVTSPVRVVFGLRNMGVAPAGVVLPETGHHHLLIDTPLPDLDRPIPADDHHRHFGKGQTETLVELEPGKHTLQILLADALHTPHKPAVVSAKITIIVQ